ncbi:hypothetical protein N474_19380 [Pseudoalteromonas luteoviolacea CPMOR-2]|uniref:Phytase-like domain-containing protein n=1 Tax=Pseudoalteromonas luteoviolacea DSM 6061 TaxID=1365250 RepID=A0A161ZUY6_9GAMM|nr:esterase-like activity of phytase family protein [Pseudoalteromonas luteoviolacea]KZN33643.1 hypothetical protein N475_19920 [Pseudoalteromonas luteoviolacea DSM 6061]KZN53735.1 hypothetical protein N474_19380 [Pseudoalteromonas luteoviolacea CPMOR-2]
MRKYLFLSMLVPFFVHCAPIQLEFLDEFVIPEDLTINGDKVGGLSSIEYSRGKYLMIADDADKPRYFQANVSIEGKKIKHVQFEHSISLIENKKQGIVDPESLRALPNNKGIVWSSEGSVKLNHPPAVFMQTKQGLSSFELPTMFNMSERSGPRHNAVFEGLSLAHSGEGIWVSMEGALKQDGEEASVEHGSLVRISYFDFATKKLQKQFAYYLEPLVKRSEAKPDAFRTTGLVEILQINKHQFLTMERSYTSGLKDGGNSVSIYLVDISNASDTSNMASLKSRQYRVAQKTLILNLNEVKHQLGSQHIDNLEGMTFGPKLTSGNQSLLMVSDNNFNIHGKQLSQVLLFEVKTTETTP